MTAPSTITALLPMKGHSERVPGKNLRPLAGRPLFHWVVDALVAVDAVESVVIDTDSEAIAESAVAAFPSVVIHWRPQEIQGDFVSMNRIIEHDLSLLPGTHFLQTHATNPLLSSDTVARAVAYYFAGLPAVDSVFTVTRHQARFFDHRGRPVNHDPAVLVRTQDLDPLFEENSVMYLFSRESFAATKARIGVTPRMFEVPPLEAIDIDEPDDWVLAEALAHRRAEQAGQE